MNKILTSNKKNLKLLKLLKVLLKFIKKKHFKVKKNIDKLYIIHK